MSKFLDSIGNVATKALISFRKNSPEIKFWGGLGLTVIGTGMAIYQSIKRVPEIKHETKIMKRDLEVRQQITDISDEEVKKENQKIVRYTFKNYVKAFALPAALSTGGLTSMVFGFLDEKTRYTLAAAEASTYAAAFAAYRKRNAELIGEENEQALYYGAQIEEIEETVFDEDGNEIGTEKRKVLVQKEPTDLDPYTYEFSHDTTDTCRENDDMYEYNMAFLVGTEKTWNHMFLDFDTKIVWLSDILRAIGLEEEARLCSRNVCWLNPKYYKLKHTDGCIKFRITPMRYMASDGHERWKFMLNFNCDGDINILAKEYKIAPMEVIGNTIP